MKIFKHASKITEGFKPGAKFEGIHFQLYGKL
jgi:hypothetical protein